MSLGNILIVDDNPDNLKLLINLLLRNGYNAHGALDGEHALSFIEKNQPHLVLLDIMLPGMNGFEICRYLKKDDKTKNIPVIFISALGELAEKENAFNAGGVDFISKPFEEIEVLSRVKTHITLYQLQLELEERVRARTLELILANEHLKQEIGDRLRAEEALKKSEKRLKHLISSVTDYIFTVTVDNGRAVETVHGPSCIRITGYSDEEYRSDTHLWYRMVHENDRMLVTEQADKALRGIESPPIEHRIIHKDGTTKWVRNTTVLKRDSDGSVIAYDGLISDITDRKRAEEAIKESEERFLAFMNYLPGLAYIKDSSGKNIFVNKRFEDFFQYDNPRMSFKKENPEDDLEALIVNDQKVLSTGTPLVTEEILSDRFWLSYRFPIRSNPENILLGGIAIDITERKRAEKAMVESEEKFHALFETMTEGVAINELIYDGNWQAMDYRIIDVNSSFSEMTGISRIDIVGRRATAVTDTIVPPYIGLYRRVVDNGLPSKFEGRLGKRDRHFNISVFSIGKGRFATVLEDITDRRKAEEAISNSLQEKIILLKEIHHRVKNNMQVIISLMNLQCLEITDGKLINYYNDMINRIKSMALIHEKLYHSDNLAKINFSDYIKELATDMIKGAFPDSKRPSLMVETDMTLLPLEQAVPCGLILNEILTNTVKHAFPESWKGRPEVHISLSNINNKTVELVVSDNGVGLPKDFDIRKTVTMGMQLIRMLVDQIGGKLEMSTEGQLQYKLKITVS